MVSSSGSHCTSQPPCELCIATGSEEILVWIGFPLTVLSLTLTKAWALATVGKASSESLQEADGRQCALEQKLWIMVVC